MTSLTPQYCRLVSCLALTVALLGMSAVAHAQVVTPTAGQSGTTLTVLVTARGFSESRTTYTWNIAKTVTPASSVIAPGASQDFIYTITATRTASDPVVTAGVEGAICVNNGGAVATENLTIVAVVLTKLGSGPFEHYTSQPVDTSDAPTILAGERACYPYNVIFQPAAPGTLYKLEAQVRITNHSGHLDEPFGPSPDADFSLPTTPTVIEIDKTATVGDLDPCPAGFTCLTDPLSPYVFTESDSITVTKTFTNDSAACNSNFSVSNTVVLKTIDLHKFTDANASIGISTPACPPVTVGCTHTIGFWKTHPREWPVLALQLGLRLYNQVELLRILNEPVRGNGLVALSHQQIAAKLNVATGATTPAGVSNDIDSADALIGAKQVPPIGTGYLPTGVTSGLVTSLDLYNNGLAEGGAPHCGE